MLVLHYHTRNTLDFSTLFFLSTLTPNINHHTLLFFALSSNYPLLPSVLPYHPPPPPPPPSSSPHKRIRRSSRTTNPISHTLLQEEEGGCSITHTTMRKLTLVFVLVSKSLVLLLLPLLHHQRLHQLFIFSFLQRNQGS